MDIGEQGYRFAISKIPEELGHVEVLKRLRIRDESGEFLETQEELKMVSCDEISKEEDDLYLFQKELVTKKNLKGMRASDYMCPDPEQKLTITGTYFEE